MPKGIDQQFKRTGIIGNHPVYHKGYPKIGPATPPQISSYVTVSWAWVDQKNGLLTWTFVNSDNTNSHAVVLYRGIGGAYIFGGAFWPIYLGPDNRASSWLDGTKPLPTASGSGNAPMGLLDFGSGASPRYLVAFIINLAPGQTWSMNEGGFWAAPTTAACYDLVSNIAGNYCVGYDPKRVTDWDNQVKNKDRGYSPDPNNVNTYAFTSEAATPENTLNYNDSIAAGPCSPKNFYFVIEKNNFGRD